MTSILFGIFIWVSAKHEEKHEGGIWVRELLNISFSNDVHESKTATPKLVTESGNFISFTFVHYAKACAWIVFTLSENSIVSIFAPSSKHESGTITLSIIRCFINGTNHSSNTALLYVKV